MIESEEEFIKKFVDIFYPEKNIPAKFKKGVIPADIILFYREVLKRQSELTKKQVIEALKLVNRDFSDHKLYGIDFVNGMYKAQGIIFDELNKKIEEIENEQAD